MKRMAVKARFLSSSALLLATVVLMPCLASALGVTPGDKTVTFSPGKSYELSFNLINNEDADLEVALSAVGELGGLLSFKEQKVLLKKGSYYAPFSVSVNLPAEMEPGVQAVSVKATPVISGSGDMFKAFVSVIIPIHIRVPFPEKYVKVSVRAIPVDDGVPVPINLEFDNLGIEDVSRAGGAIQVYSPKGVLIENLTVPEISVQKNTFAKSEGQPIIPLARGVYLAEAQAYYDEREVYVSKNLSVGKPLVRISSFLPKIAAGKISPVSFKAASDWNVNLEASGFLILDGVQSEIPAFILQPGVEKEISAYYDATNTVPGTRELTLRLEFAGVANDYKFNVSVQESAAEGIIGLPSGVNIQLVLVSTACILVIVILAVFWLMSRRKKKGAPPQEPPQAPRYPPERSEPQQDAQRQVQDPNLPIQNTFSQSSEASKDENL